jgi:hypothetical protein
MSQTPWDVTDREPWKRAKEILEGGQWDFPLPPHPILMAYDARGSQRLMVHVVDGPPIPLRVISGTDDQPMIVRVCTPACVPKNAVAVARSVAQTTHVVTVENGGVHLHVFDVGDKLIQSRVVPYADVWPDEQVTQPPVIPVPLFARPDVVYLGLGDRLVILKSEAKPRFVDLPDIAYSLHGSAPYSRPRLVATLEQGAVVYFEDTGKLVSVAGELAQPVAAFTVSGWLVIAGEKEAQIYHTKGDEVGLAAKLSYNVRPIAVLEGPHPDQFALFREDGVVQLYQTPRR